MYVYVCVRESEARAAKVGGGGVEEEGEGVEGEVSNLVLVGAVCNADIYICTCVSTPHDTPHTSPPPHQ